MRTPSLKLARRFADLHRRTLAALCAAICLFAVLNIVSPAQPDSVNVVTPTREIPAGSRVGAEDVALASVSNINLPADVLTDTSAAIGQIAVLPLKEKTPLAEGMLLPSTVPPGLRQVPVRVSDPGITKLVSPGSRVSVFGVLEDGAPAQIVSNARVVTILSSESSSGIGQSDSVGTILLLEVPKDQAVSVANASLQRSLSLILE